MELEKVMENFIGLMKVFKGNFKNGKPNGTGVMIQDNKEKNIFFKDGVIQGEVLNEKME